MSTLTEDELIRNRLITDEKFLRHAAKLYSQFLVDDGSDEKKAALLRALEYCEDFIDRHHKIQKMNEMQLDQHRQECMRLECEIANEETAIKELREKLKDAMQDRKNKEEYDLVAEQIVKIPSRQQSQRRIKSLIAEQQALESISEAQLNLVEMRRSKLKVLFEEMEQLRTEFENNKSADESYSQIAGDDYEDEQQQQNAAAVNNEDE